MSEKKKLPTIQELYSDKTILSKQNDLNVLLNQNPKDEWLKNHPTAKKVRYLPIERVEWLLTSIFVKWYVEIKDVQLIANSTVVTVRLHYRNPITSEMEFQDGVGAAPLQTDKEASATDWTKIKSDAVMKAVPAAESYAVKDAAEKIGKLFGKDMNRADQIMYDTLLNKFESNEKLLELISLIDQCKPEDQKEYKTILQSKKKQNKLTEDEINLMISDVKNTLRRTK